MQGIRVAGAPGRIGRVLRLLGASGALTLTVCPKVRIEYISTWTQHYPSLPLIPDQVPSDTFTEARLNASPHRHIMCTGSTVLQKKRAHPHPRLKLTAALKRLTCHKHRSSTDSCVSPRKPPAPVAKTRPQIKVVLEVQAPQAF